MTVLEFVRNIVTGKIKRPPKTKVDVQLLGGTRSHTHLSQSTTGNRFAFANFKKLRDQQRAQK